MKGIHRKGFKMFIYEVRIFGGLNWYVIRTYADHDEAASFGRMLREPAAKEAFSAFMEKRKPDFSKL